MGGNALKNINTRRLDKVEYLTIKDEVINILKKEFRQVTIPLYYRNKETFGDLDVIVGWYRAPEDVINGDGILNGDGLRAYIETTFKPREIIHTKNDNQWSFDYKECQVDLIMCDYEDFWCYYHFYAYNGLGALLLVILAKNMGLVYSRKGLAYQHYFKGEKIGTILISKDNKAIYKFMRLDYLQFMRGFDTMDEIFEFIISSEYFYHDSPNINKLKKTRWVNINDFMKYFELSHHKSNYRDPGMTYVNKAIETFDTFNYTEETRKLEYEYTRDAYVKSKFNGKMVIDEFGFEGGMLGNKLNEFKKYFKDELSYKEFIIETDKKDIMIKFKEVCCI